MNFQEKLNSKWVGRICLGLGSIFVVAGIVLFIMLNSVNLYSQKTVATIVSRTEVKVDEPYVYLELAYRVGDEMVYSNQAFREEIPEDQIEMDVYYNIKDPKTLEDGGWNFQPIAILLIGAMIAFIGVYYIKAAAEGIDNKFKGKRSKLEEKYYKVKDRFESDAIMLAGAVSLLIFGIIIRIFIEGFWPWIIIGISGVATIYILIDFIPVIKEYVTLRSVKNVNKKVVTVDDDFEKFEKEQEAKKLKKQLEEFDVEETYEIKNVKSSKNKKK